MAAITETVTTITKMVRGNMEAILINAIMGQPTLNSVRNLAEQIASFASHLATTEWGEITVSSHSSRAGSAIHQSNLPTENATDL